MNTSSSFFSTVWKRRLLIIPPLLIGVAAIVLSPLMKSKPQETQSVERAVKVRAITVSTLAVTPRATGYGTVKPAHTWEAVAEVAGQVEWVSEDLKNGHTVPIGTEVLRIEDVNYRLNLAQIDAQLQASDVKDKTTRASLSIAEREFKILTTDYQRKKGLAAKGAVAKTAVEAAERQMLNGETQVQNLRNTVELNSVERQVLVAQRASAELDLQRTHLIAPFSVRITDVNIGQAQYANKGQLLFAADGLKMAEVEAQFPIGILRPLIRAAQSDSSSSSNGVMKLNALVRLHTSTHVVEWPARIDRVSGVIDPQTQSLGVVVAIDWPLDQAQPGNRPPLYRNTFVEVVLSSSPMAEQIVVPLSAIHNGQIYVVDEDSRLEIRPVEVTFIQSGYAVLEKGIAPGERIVTSDLTTVVQGILLAPVDDKKTAATMIFEATGREQEH